MKLHNDGQTLKDIIVGYFGMLISAAATVAEVLPFLLGLGLSAYALYNQHQQAKINRMKIKKMENEGDK